MFDILFLHFSLSTLSFPISFLKKVAKYFNSLVIETDEFVSAQLRPCFFFFRREINWQIIDNNKASHSLASFLFVLLSINTNHHHSWLENESQLLLWQTNKKLEFKLAQNSKISLKKYSFHIFVLFSFFLLLSCHFSLSLLSNLQINNCLQSIKNINIVLCWMLRPLIYIIRNKNMEIRKE